MWGRSVFTLKNCQRRVILSDLLGSLGLFNQWDDNTYPDKGSDKGKGEEEAFQGKTGSL